MRDETRLLRRLIAKLAHDVLPAALASVIGGFLFTHFQLGRAPEPPAAATAPAEMMQLLRDEHGLMVDFLHAEMVKEKAQLAAAEVAPPPAAAPVADQSAAPRRTVVAAATARSALPPRGKSTVASAPLAPLVIAELQPDATKPAARDDDSLLARTVGLKDHVVAVTRRVVSAIGGIPSWIGSIGDHIGGQDAVPRPPVELVSTS